MLLHNTGVHLDLYRRLDRVRLCAVARAAAGGSRSSGGRRRWSAGARSNHCWRRGGTDQSRQVPGNLFVCVDGRVPGRTNGGRPDCQLGQLAVYLLHQRADWAARLGARLHGARAAEFAARRRRVAVASRLSRLASGAGQVHITHVDEY